MSWKRIVAEALYPDIFISSQLLQDKVNVLEGDNDYFVEVNNDLQEEVTALTDIGIELQEELASLRSDIYTELEEHCLSNYDMIDMIAYKGKRTYHGKSVDLYVGEMITPNAFEVVRARNRLTYSIDRQQWAIKIGNMVSRKVTWTSDSTLNASTKDVYLYANEVLVSGKGDCEDHSFVVSSIEPEIGVAYGFYHDEKGKYGHAFNVFILNGELYILETTGNKARVEKYSETKNYTIYFIFTKDMAFRVKRGVSFGTIAHL
ncbi:MAG: hypothetical protein U9R08_03425 [Nanoarchaeota archaeon]|nr:hypothetical protein [Nanoarchaeota archaeon]